jgi:predicted Fe-Mo cluster-binding NifX family protein
MTTKPANIKVVIAAGVSVPDAIKAALPGTASAFAERHGFLKPHVSMCIYGRGRYETVRAALASELNVEREWLDEVLDAQRAAQAEAAA